MNPNQILANLKELLDDSSLETISALLEDPGADHTPSQLARVGSAFSELGKLLSDTARHEMLTRMSGSGSPISEDGVLFKYRAASERVSIDTALIRSTFPIEEYGGFYKKQQIRETVVIQIERE